MKPVAQMFPEDRDQLRLPPGAPSGLIPFQLDDPGVDSMALRLVAVGPGCESSGGQDPTIELRAGSGVVATVPPQPEVTEIFNEEEGSGLPLATASYLREPNDVFMVELTIVQIGVEPLWRVRITNNDIQELGFVWAVAHVPTDTMLPRTSKSDSAGVTGFIGEPAPAIELRVANHGPGTLIFNDPIGADLGKGFSLETVDPRHVKPNHCGTLTFHVDETLGERSAACVLDTNDRDERKKAVRLDYATKRRPEPQEPPKGFDKEDIKEGAIDKPGAPPEYLKPGDTLRADTLSGVGEEAFAGQLTALDESISRLVHFIGPELRPDLSASAFAHEDPDRDGPAERDDEGR